MILELKHLETKTARRRRKILGIWDPKTWFFVARKGQICCRRTTLDSEILKLSRLRRANCQRFSLPHPLSSALCSSSLSFSFSSLLFPSPLSLLSTCSPRPWYVEFSAALRAAPSLFLVRSFLGYLARGEGVQR